MRSLYIGTCVLGRVNRQGPETDAVSTCKSDGQKRRVTATHQYVFVTPGKTKLGITNDKLASIVWKSSKLIQNIDPFKLQNLSQILLADTQTLKRELSTNCPYIST